MALLPACLPPLVAQSYDACRVVLVDNASSDESVAYVRQTFPSVEIIQNSSNLGFAQGINAGLRALQSPSDYTILLNNDVVVSSSWVAEFVAAMQPFPDLGVAGCKLLFPNGKIQHLGGQIGFPEVESSHPHQFEPDKQQIKTAQDVDYVTGAAFAISRQALQTVGLLDEWFSPFYFEEVDYCYRVRAAGLRVMLLPTVQAIHDESSSVNLRGQRAEWFHTNRVRFAARHVGSGQFETGFLSAEQTRLAGSSAEIVAMLGEIYLKVALELPRHLPAHSFEALATRQAALLALREITFQTPVTPAHETLVDWTFDSDVPLVGGVIGWARARWYGVASRWAVRGVMQRQGRFNRDIEARLTHSAAERQRLGSEIGRIAQELTRLQRQTHSDDTETR